MQTQATLRRSIRISALVASPVLFLAACSSAATNDDPASIGAVATADSQKGDTVARVATVTRGDVASPLDSNDDAGAEEDAGYFACASASECVAVRMVSDDCCYNGWKIAVASSAAEAYLQATACTPARGQLCPQYIVDDRLVPTCDVAARRCMMVAPNETADAGPPPL